VIRVILAIVVRFASRRVASRVRRASAAFVAGRPHSSPRAMAARPLALGFAAPTARRRAVVPRAFGSGRKTNDQIA
jgi:hypothetical protein